MRPLRLLLLLSFVALSGPAAFAQGGLFQRSPEKLDDRIVAAVDRLTAMQDDPQKRIPTDLLARAHGIVIMRKFKAGFLIGGEAGNGVALVRDQRTGAWSAPAFVAAAAGSYGLQLGAQESDIVLLLMSETALKPLMGGSLNVGVDVSATVGPVEEDGGFDTTTLRDPVLVYTSSDGLFAGAAFKGGGLLGARRANETYYRSTMETILFERTVRPTASGVRLIEAIEQYAGRRSRY